MKPKYLFLILLIVLFCPFIVFADTCKVISGDGTKLGDEIACGDEHFYVLENKDGKVDMITKYNLYVGNKIIKATDYYDDEYEAYDACLALHDTYGEDNVAVTIKYGDVDKYFCRAYIPLEYDSVKQNELAKGLYPNGDREIAYPIYGEVFLGDDVLENEFDENNDMIYENSNLKDYFLGYKDTLEKLGVKVLDMGFIKRSGVQKIIDDVGTEKLEIPKQVDYADIGDWEEDYFDDYDAPVYKVNIKDIIPEKYKWIYGTTYWTGSSTKDVSEYPTHYDEFLTTNGDYCSFDRGCSIVRIGVGLRPVITIDAPLVEEVKEKEEVVEENPFTFDKISIYFTICILSTLGIFTISKRHN